MPSEPDEDLRVEQDGSLIGDYPFVSWQAGDTTVCLDGNFTIEHLEAIVRHMRTTDTQRPDDSK